MSRWVFWVFVFIFGCSSSKHVGVVEKEYREDVNTLIDQIDGHRFVYETLSSKAAVKYEGGGKKLSFKVSVRSECDKKIWASISPAMGIEVARVLITPDSVKIIDRLHKKYFVGDFSFLNKQFNTHVSFELLQSVLVGNPLPFDRTINWYIGEDKKDGSVYISNLRKREIRKVLKKEKIKKRAQVLWVDIDRFKIRKAIIKEQTLPTLNRNNAKKVRFVSIQNTEFIDLEKQILPKLIDLAIKSIDPLEPDGDIGERLIADYASEATISFNFSKQKINTSFKTPFSIPKKYAPIVIK